MTGPAAEAAGPAMGYAVTVNEAPGRPPATTGRPGRRTVGAP